MSVIFDKKLGVDRLPQPLVEALEPLRRERAIRRYTRPGLRRDYPSSADELRASSLLDAWWYYSVELLPGVVARGFYPDDLPMLPRMLMRRCDVSGQSCLDIGTMEALMPVLMRKRGAREVLAVDFSNHCVGKMAAVQHYHGVDFDYRSVGLMYELGQRLRSRSFDVINLSGLLYHVFSPLTLLAAVRPLLKRNGIMVVSTYVTLDPGPVMDFNARGRMWAEGNTFWFASAALLDYLLRYMRLRPIDCMFMPADELRRPGLQAVGRVSKADFGKDMGYLAVACRAVDRADDDTWMEESAATSWEYHGLADWSLADRRPASSVAYEREPEDGIALDAAARERPPVVRPAAAGDSHMLTLADAS